MLQYDGKAEKSTSIIERQQVTKITEFPFDSNRKRMSVVINTWKSILFNC